MEGGCGREAGSKSWGLMFSFPPPACIRAGNEPRIHTDAHGWVEWRAVKRRLFTILSALSLLLFVAVCVLWVRSAKHYDRLDYKWVSEPPISRRTYIITSYAGQCRVAFVAFDLKQVPANPVQGGWAYQSAARSTTPGVMWPPYRESAFSTEFAFTRRPWAGTTVFGSAASVTDWSVAFPVWVAVVLSGVLPAGWSVMRLRKRIAGQRGHCPSCGYDLRATPRRCPECGRVPAAPPTPVRGNFQCPVTKE